MKKLIILLLIIIENNAFSQQKGVKEITQSSRPILGQTYAVVVGISDYQDPGIPDLNYADKDAQAFANFLRSKAGGKLDNNHLKVLLNSSATMAQFANALDWLLEVCKENDQVYIYFSGHGDVEKKTMTQPGYLLCWDALLAGPRDVPGRGDPGGRGATRRARGLQRADAAGRGPRGHDVPRVREREAPQDLAPPPPGDRGPRAPAVRRARGGGALRGGALPGGLADEIGRDQKLAVRGDGCGAIV